MNNTWDEVGGQKKSIPSMKMLPLEQQVRRRTVTIGVQRYGPALRMDSINALNVCPPLLLDNHHERTVCSEPCLGVQ